MPALLTFAALALLALVCGVSLTRLLPALAGQNPGLVSLCLLLLFWAGREAWQRRRTEARLLAEIDTLADEVMRLRGTATAAPVAPVANEPRRAEPRLVVPAAVPAAVTAPEPADDGTLLDAVRDALNHNRVELHVQPIVSLPQRRIRFFELLARPRDAEGKSYQAAPCLDALDAAGLRAEFDALMLLRGVQLVRRLEQRAKDVGFFLNLSPDMLAAAETFEPVFAFLEREREKAGNIVLEFAHEGLRRLDRAGQARLARLGVLGFAVSVDGVDRFDLDYAGLARMGVRFVKFNAAAFADEAAVARAPVALADLREVCSRHELLPVLAKVESEADLVRLGELDFPFGQGLLFGAPKLARAA